MKHTNKSVYEEALNCTGRGWRVLPVHGIVENICTCNDPNCKSPGKHPRIKDWKKNATIDTRIIKYWWERWPDSNLGILTGQLSGIVVLDIDPRNGGDNSFDDLVNTYGRIPDTVESITGGGGGHLFLKYPGRTIKCRTNIFPGIDIKADNGFIVAPPSVHISGSNYEWEVSSHPDENECIPMPDWLLKLADDYVQRNHSEIENPEIIRKGERNTRLTSIAGSLRRHGLNEQAISNAILVINKSVCASPLPEDEIRDISKSISRYKPLSTNIDISKFHCTDSGNAELIAALFGNDLRYNNDRKQWLYWNGNIWQIDETGEAARMALSAAQYRYRLAIDLESYDEKKKHANCALKSEDDYRIRAALNCAQHVKIFSKITSDFDQNPYLLGCSNGIVDLKTGELRPGQQEDMITMSTGISFNPDAKTPRWEQFIKEVNMNDPVMIDFIHRFVGYSLTGSIDEQVFAMCYGNGSNGKSVFLSTLRGIMGDYASNTSFSTFESIRNSSKIPNDLAALVGKRLVVVSEVQEGSRWNEGLIKSVTGGDMISARFLHGEFFNYHPHFKLWMGVNHKPGSTDISDAFWRRVHLIEFLNNFKGENRDNNLTEKLKVEYPGILAWLVAGCQKWLEKGLSPPKKVLMATAEYRHEEDIIQSFLDERTINDADAKVQAQILYDDYKDWCQQNGIRPITGTKFGRQMKEKGCHKDKFGASRSYHYFGIGLINENAEKRG